MNPTRISPPAFWAAASMLVIAAAVLVSRIHEKQTTAVEKPLVPEMTSMPAGAIRAVLTQGSVQDMSRPAVNAGADMGSLLAQLRVCLAETDPERQAQLEEALEAGLTDANAAEILRALPQDLLATTFAEAALRRWVTVDRKSAAGWVAQQAGLTEPEQTSVVYGWGAEDKKALDDYLNNLPAGGWKQSAMKFAASDALASGTPKDAIDLLVQMDRTPARDDLMDWSATAWAQSDAKAAVQWANELPDAAQKQAALGAVAVGFAWSDPQAAGKLLAEQVQPGETLERSATSVVCVWSQSDPQAAANWVAAFPEGKLQQSIMETLIQRWATQDLVATKNWVNELPLGTLHDSAQKFYAAAAANLQREPGQELSAQ